LDTKKREKRDSEADVQSDAHLSLSKRSKVEPFAGSLGEPFQDWPAVERGFSGERAK
tara:strand:- start:579 stop:749 length:171 start_codon:yes stop_codon:yes gene_type:complete